MKIISAILVSSMCLSLLSCTTPSDKKVHIGPEVANRDAKGHYILPACPICGAMPTSTTVLYQDCNGHTYHGPISQKK